MDKGSINRSVSSSLINGSKVYKMLYKMSLSVNEIPPLFVQLDQLEQKDDANTPTWNEKARWIRYEEQAEDVLGRWSKPHVATLAQTSIDELKHLLDDGKMIFDALLTDMKEIADAIANELLDYFNDLDSARLFAEILCQPHHHHHEKKIKRNTSQTNLPKVMSSPNLKDQNLSKDIPEAASIVNHHNQSMVAMSTSNKLKYQYSFTDAMQIDDPVIQSSFKENTKFKKKVHNKSEGASVLVMPVDFVKKSKLVFLRLEAATELQHLLEVKLRSRFIALIIGPMEKQNQLYEVGRAMCSCIADDVCRELFYSATTKDEIRSAVDHFNRGSMVIPPSEWNPRIRIEPPEKFLSKEERTKENDLCNYIHDEERNHGEESGHEDPSLNFTNKPFGGVYNDLSRKLPHYFSDFTDFFNLQCIATTMYMYLVSLCSLVAFGGMIDKKTGNQMATMECILAGSVSGILFSLFSGQPLNIISATGPMLILEIIIKTSICDPNNINFMTFRLWVGIWTAVFLVLIVMFNLSFLVKYITRFTEDSFAALVAIIFIMDAFKNVLELHPSFSKNPSPIIEVGFNLNNSNFTESVVQQPPLNSQKEINFYFSVILFFLTYFVCSSLKELRNKPYLPTKVREFFSNFAVLIAILIAASLDAIVGLEGTAKLKIPTSFEPTSDRNWFVSWNFEDGKWYWALIAIGPALIATILVFMDQQITAVIINRKEFQLKKSNGFHLDLFVVAISIAVSSMLGLPWFVAATVLALSHINSLKMMSENTAPGERPKYLGIREQRGTTLIMSILIGLSIFLAPILSHIPMAVLYGVFLFMGISALNGMQFIDRLYLFLMPAKYQPDYKYLRYVSIGRVHLFTIIQLISTAGLYAIKNADKIAILFPVLVLATCGIRKLLDYVFSQSELFYLDDILPGSDKLKKYKNEKKILTNANDSSSEFLKSNEKDLVLGEKIILLDSSEQFSLLDKCVRDGTDADLENGIVKKQVSIPNSNVKFVTSFTNIEEIASS